MFKAYSWTQMTYRFKDIYQEFMIGSPKKEGFMGSRWPPVPES